MKKGLRSLGNETQLGDIVVSSTVLVIPVANVVGGAPCLTLQAYRVEMA